MNFLKGVLGLGNKEQRENFLEFRGMGRLFLIQQKVKKCVFILSQITFIQGKKDPYERYVYVKNLSDSSEFNTDEYYFSVKENFNLRSYTTKTEDEEIIGYEWDLDGGVSVSYEFSTQVTDDLTAAVNFKHHLCRLICENKYRQPADNVSDEDLDRFCRDKDKEIILPGASGPISKDSNMFKPRSEVKETPQEQRGDDLARPIVNRKTLEWNKPEDPQLEVSQSGFDDLIRNFDKVEINKAKQQEETKSNAPAKKARPFGSSQLYTKEDAKSLMEIPTTLCEVNEQGQPVVLMPQANLFIVDADNFQYYFEVFDENMEILYKRPIQSDLNYYVDDVQSSFKWVEIKQDSGDIAVYACRIPADLLNSFKLVFSQCLYEANNQERVEDTFKKEEERQYVRRWFENDIETVEELKSQENDEMEIEDNYISSSEYAKGQNTGQVQAKLLDRTFVSQGPVVSVYMSNDEENTLDYLVSLPTLKNLEGSEIRPKKMMMHEQDAKMLMLSDPESTKVYYMDIARGKIINEYEGDGVNRFTDLAPTSKHAEFGHNPCFITANPRNLFLIDPRVGEKNKCVAEKIYATAPKFTCIATNDADGNFATGSEKGEVRLYSKVGQNAKSLFPGFGDPIIGLDSTKDGVWLLATTKNYLMLMPTVIDGKNGYKQSISKEAKVPFRMTILPTDMKKYKIMDINFQPAKFNDNENDVEKFIMASTGEFLVTWSLKNVLRGQANKYEIKKVDDYVVSNEFRYKKEDNLLVTLPKEVRIQKAHFH